MKFINTQDTSTSLVVHMLYNLVVVQILKVVYRKAFLFYELPKNSLNYGDYFPALYCSHCASLSID